MNDRRLAAEVRAVEEGHRAWVIDEDLYWVVSDSHPGQDYVVEVRHHAGLLLFVCSCPARVRHCKHSQLVARRMEREGNAVLDRGDWSDPHYKPEPIDLSRLFPPPVADDF